MSGGHWDYDQYKVKDLLERVVQDEEVAKRFPRLARVLSKLGDDLYDVVHDLDWDLSGDSSIENDRVFEQEALEKLSAIVVEEIQGS